MELKDTIEMMQSADYKERFKAEYHQVQIRYEKLLAMLMKREAGKLDFEPTCPIKILYAQASIMDEYLDILKERARIEGVCL